MKTFLKRLSLCLGGMLVLLLLFHLVEDVRGRRAWTRWKQARIAAGDSFDLAPLVPPPVPDAENFARAPRIAESMVSDPDASGPKLPVLPASLFESPAMGRWQEGRRTDLERLKTEQKVKDMKELLDPWEGELAALAEAAKRPRCRLVQDYGNFDAIPLLLGMRARGRVLALRALAALHERRPDAALEDVLTGLRVAAHLQREPQLLSQLLRLAWVNIMLQPVWEGLQDRRWSEAQLARLQEALQAIDLVDSVSRAWRFERLYMAQSLERTAEGSPWSRRGMVPDWKGRVLGFFLPGGWIHQNLLRADRQHAALFQDVFDPARHLIHARAGQAAAEAFGRTRATPYTFLVMQNLPALMSQNVRAARSQSGLDMAVLACALERHRLAKGSYPATLEALVPAHLPKAPADVVEGQPLRYAPGREGYTLYSMGWDLTDEGGAPAPKEAPEKGDWVWSRAR